MEYSVRHLSKILFVSVLLVGCSQQVNNDKINELEKELNAKDELIHDQQQAIDKLEKEIKEAKQAREAVITKEIILERRVQDKPYKVCPNPVSSEDFPCVVQGPESVPVVRGYKAD